MVTFLYVVVVLSCLIVITSVLLQPSKGGGISALGGSSQSVFGSTGGTTFLFRTTLILGAVIGLACILITRIQIDRGQRSVIDTAVPAIPQNAAPANALPETSTPAPTESNK